MDNKFRYSLTAQMLKTLKTQLFTALMFFLLWLITINLMVIDWVNMIFAIIATITCFFAIYGTSYDVVNSDKKSYTPQRPYIAKGLLLPLLIEAANVLMLILYKCSWYFGSNEHGLNTVFGLIGNILFKMWTIMYDGYVSIGNGNISLFAYIMIFGMPVVASFVGYFAGYKNFDLASKINSIAYEKKKK
ncbi:MAG: hypothetical protein PUB42_02985 [Firmicutes bacterium]|nr:hypothetical protein [Bacillota bacterium]